MGSTNLNWMGESTSSSPYPRVLFVPRVDTRHEQYGASTAYVPVHDAWSNDAKNGNKRYHKRAERSSILSFSISSVRSNGTVRGVLQQLTCLSRPGVARRR
jgi:hypothetical protein